mmetsp:Transcript_51051/g.102383  ORF Transcript_51051/g.102383 Transcript_51051/m.102383 type:complete len:92 (-) Transcript_51051:79-354(-)
MTTWAQWGRTVNRMLVKLWDTNFDPKNMKMPLGSFSENQADLVNKLGLAASDTWGHDNVGAMGANSQQDACQALGHELRSEEHEDAPWELL